MGTRGAADRGVAHEELLLKLRADFNTDTSAHAPSPASGGETPPSDSESSRGKPRAIHDPGDGIAPVSRARRHPASEISEAALAVADKIVAAAESLAQGRPASAPGSLGGRL